MWDKVWGYMEKEGIEAQDEMKNTDHAGRKTVL
jgi:hypothetical protein